MNEILNDIILVVAGMVVGFLISRYSLPQSNETEEKS